MNLTNYIDNLDNFIHSRLSAHRYTHSVSVAQTAQKLAQYFNYKDPQLAYFTGLGHDIAREMPVKDLIILTKQLGRFKEGDEHFPLILHGRVAAHIIQQALGFYRADVDQAFCQHTTGGPNMTVLDQILYVADYIEPGRPYLTSLQLQLKDYTLNSLAEYVLKQSLNYLQSHGLQIYSDTADWVKQLENTL